MNSNVTPQIQAGNGQQPGQVSGSLPVITMTLQQINRIQNQIKLFKQLTARYTESEVPKSNNNG